MKLHILDPGPLTTVQDKGRIGYMEYGVTTSGVMDRKSYEQGNKLVGNQKGAAVLEATLLGPRLQIEGEGLIAVTGADMQASLNGQALERGRAYEVRDGQLLTFGMAKSGVRAYLAVSGGIDVPIVMGSRSTNLKVGIGGLDGRKLKTGDVLATLPVDEAAYKKQKPVYFKPSEYKDTCSIRVVLGPQDDVFTEESIQSFFHEAYTVTPESDRMGIRLSGQELTSKNGMDIVSDGITFGSIQVTSKGLPIILMADHQTTGGYAKIATVVTEDLSILAQARPGTKLLFQPVSVEEMQKKSSILTRLFGRKAV